MLREAAFVTRPVHSQTRWSGENFSFFKKSINEQKIFQTFLYFSDSNKIDIDKRQKEEEKKLLKIKCNKNKMIIYSMACVSTLREKIEKDTLFRSHFVAKRRKREFNAIITKMCVIRWLFICFRFIYGNIFLLMQGKAVSNFFQFFFKVS